MTKTWSVAGRTVTKRKYWDEAKFRAAMEAGDADGMMPMLQDMAVIIACKYNSGRYALEPEEAYSIALSMAWLKMDRYDPARSTTFNFFTKVMINAIYGESRSQRSAREREAKAAEMIAHELARKRAEQGGRLNGFAQKQLGHFVGMWMSGHIDELGPDVDVFEGRH
jgi:hypothetical protein